MRVFTAVAFATPLVWASTVKADGEPVAGFGVNGVVIDGGFSQGRAITVLDLAALRDGSLVVTGYLAPTFPGGPSAPFLAKYLSSGKRDPSFGVDGLVLNFLADFLAPLPGGRVLASMTFGSMTIVSPTGQLTPGPNLSGSVTDLLPRPDGGVIAIGSFLGSPFNQLVAKVITPAGVVDTTFNADVESLFPRSVTPPIVFSKAFSGTITSDGRLIVQLVRPVVSGPTKGCTLVAFNAAGGIDTSFGSGGFVDPPVPLGCRIDRFVDDDSIRAIPTSAPGQTLQYSSDGVFLQPLGSPFDNPALVSEGTGYSYVPDGASAITSFDPIGSVDPTFGVNGTATLPGMTITAIKLLDSGNIVAWGNAVGDPTALALGLVVGSYGTAPQPPAVDTAKFVPVPPKRILDTRDGTGAPQAKLGVGGQIDLQIAGAGGVPGTDVSGVVLNVTATEATQAGYVTVYPSGARRPTVSNLNLETTGQTAANLVTVKVGANGKVTLFTSGGTHLVADVAGYYTPAVTSTDGRLQTAAPKRILDTRDGTGAPRAKLAAGGQIDLQVTGVDPVPATGVSAVVLNLTGDQASLDGFVTAWPTGIDRPVVSNLNLVTGETRPNLVIVPVGAGGKVSLFTSGGTDLIADVAGWFTDTTALDDSVGLFVPITPTRMLDTRQEPTAPTAPVSSLTRLIGSTTVVPPNSTIAVAANITVTQSTGVGFVTAWPAHTPQPLVSNLNATRAGQTIPNAAIVPLGQDELALYIQSGAHVIVDIDGWYTNF